jgi:hypothetical protein
VVERRKIAAIEEAQAPLSEQRCAPSRSAMRIADTLHRIGLNVMVISIVAHIVGLIVVSRHPKATDLAVLVQYDYSILALGGITIGARRYRCA